MQMHRFVLQAKCILRGLSTVTVSILESGSDDIDFPSLLRVTTYP